MGPLRKVRQEISHNLLSLQLLDCVATDSIIINEDRLCIPHTGSVSARGRAILCDQMSDPVWTVVFIPELGTREGYTKGILSRRMADTRLPGAH
jgi:hypothetical protein